VLQSAYYDRLPAEMQAVRKHNHLHSFYLNFCADFGLTGGAILFIIVLSLLTKLWRAGLSGRGFPSALAFGVFWGAAGILAGDCFDTLLRGPATAMELFWLIGLTCGINRESKRSL
jgi:hypothetical protein